MEIVNKTKKTVIAKDALHAQSFFSRMRGLMLRRRPIPLVIEAPNQGVETTSIHMFFMLFSIDVIWADEKGAVVDLREGIKPFSLRIFKPKKPAKYVIEVPVGTITESRTKVGDKLSI